MPSFTAEDSLKIPISELKIRAILEKRESLILLLELLSSDGNIDKQDRLRIRAKTISLFTELRENIRMFYPERYSDIERLVYSIDNADHSRAFKDMDKIIYQMTENNKELWL